MPQRVQLRRSSTGYDQPSSLLSGELAVNTADKKIWLGDNAGIPLDLLSPFVTESLTVTGSASIAQDLSVGRSVGIDGFLRVGGNVLLQGSALQVNGAAAFEQGAQVIGAVGVNGTLNVTGLSTFYNGVTTPGPVYFGGTLTAAGSTLFTGPVAVAQNYGGLASLGLYGNGSVTPNKSLRAVDGVFDIVNSDYNRQLLVLTDVGDMQLAGGLTVLGAADFHLGVVCEHELVVNGTATVANLTIPGLLSLASLTVSPGGLTTLGGNVQIGLGVRIIFATNSTLNFPSGSVFEAPDDATALAVGVGPRDVYFNTTSNALTIRRS